MTAASTPPPEPRQTTRQTTRPKPQSTPRPKPLSKRELASFRGMLQVHAEVTHALDARLQRDHDLSIAAYEVLMFLEDAPDRRLRMSEIAERVLLTRSGCTRLIDRLTDAGAISRCTAECDGRGLYATLTDTGLEKLLAARVSFRETLHEVFLDRLTDADQRALAEIWTRFPS